MSIFFAEDFMKTLPDDPVQAGYAITQRFLDIHRKLSSDVTEQMKHYEEYLAALGLFQAFGESYGISLPYPLMGPNQFDNLHAIRDFFERNAKSLGQLYSKLLVESAKQKYLPRFGKTFAYEFSEGDFKRVQELINELRDLITQSPLFEEDHKRRLLRRLEKLQAELHKKVTNLDVFWGLVGDAGVAIGKFGNDVKPIVDRITELVQIIWRTQARAEELPSAAPFPQLTEGKPE